MWVYIRTEPGLFTVGFYDPDGKFCPDSDHNASVDAAARVHYLNGGVEGAIIDAERNIVAAIERLPLGVRN